MPEAAFGDFAATPPGTWLLEHVQWTEAEHRIAAINADPETAELLAMPGGAACLSLDRRTWRAGKDITHVRQIFPGTAYDLVARFTPSGNPPQAGRIPRSAK